MQDSLLLQAYREHESELIRFLAKRLKCVFTAADLAHELYLKLLTGQEAAAIQNGRAYLFRMAANMATDHIRGETRHGQILAEAGAYLWGRIEGLTPEQHAVTRAELAHLERAVATLPERSRQIFHLNRFEGLSQREIAGRLGISLTAVEKHMRRALDCLAEARRSFEG